LPQLRGDLTRRYGCNSNGPSPLMPIIADQIKFSGSMTANADVTGFTWPHPCLKLGAKHG